MKNWIAHLPAGTNSEYGKGEYISHPQAHDNRLIILRSGQVRICLLGGAREQTLGYLNSGSLFVTHTPAWLEVVQPTQITSWPLTELRELIIQQPDMAIMALREVGQLMSNTIELIENLAFRSAEERLARHLLRTDSGSPSASVTLIDNIERTASFLGISRQTLSTLINQMQKEGIIEKTGRQTYLIIDRDRLEQISRGASAS